MFSELTYGTALPAPHCERVPGITHWCKAVNNQSLPVENSQVSHISKAFYILFLVPIGVKPYLAPGMYFQR